MRAFVLALSFIRVPRLFVSLLLWPLVIGLFALFAEIVFSTTYLKLLKMDEKTAERRLSEQGTDEFLRDLVFGKKPPPSRPQICTWTGSGGAEEIPAGCTQAKSDVIVQVTNPASFDAAEFVNAFSGGTERIHICKACTGDIVIRPEAGRSDLASLKALGVFALVDQLNFKSRKRLLVESISERRKLEKLEGTVLFHPKGLSEPVNVTETQERMIVVLNVAFLIIIALWLALKAHRKVLDYFAKNGALLPLVAACGKSDFYAALWIITVVRVGFFLLASVPASVIILSRTLSTNPAHSFSADVWQLTAWIISLSLGLGLLTIIGSIAELKQRQSWTSFLYKYVPFFCCLMGGLSWIAAVLGEGPSNALIQDVIAAVPIFGLTPVLLSPIFEMDVQVMVAHSAMSLLLIALTLRANARWFASHLEEI